MRLTVQLFASAREALGGDVQVEVPEPATASHVLAALARFEPIRELVPRSRLAVGRSFARPETEVLAGAEVALIPPVSGG